jgi:hypothetical protein
MASRGSGDEVMIAPEIVLLGGPDSGKTHYAGQLYGRLQRRPGRLKLRAGEATPGDLTALEEVLACLESGRAAQHTPVSTWTEVRLPLTDDRGHAMDLSWPDYGGESVRAVLTDRVIPTPWRARITAAQGWIVLIRLKSEVVYPDKLEQLLQQADAKPASNIARATTWDANARWVELLQMLLHVAEVDTVQRVRRPRLAVLLSCYDELDAGSQDPGEVLRQRLPLVSAFLASTWSAGQMTVWGLSALGRPLVKDTSDADFTQDGPEHQGWIMPPGGGLSDPDLSRPLAWLLGSA